MHVVKSRWLALAAICIGLGLVSGCQIDSSTGTVSDLRYVKVSPDLKLHAPPEGYIYELWIFSITPEVIVIDEDSVIVIPTFSDPEPLVRFGWDPYLYAATDVDGNFLPLTTSNGMELPDSVDIAPYFASNVVTSIAMLTIEPIDDPNPLVPFGPTFLALNIDPNSHTAFIINPYALLSFFGIPPPIASFNLLSQSNKKSTPGSRWRDNETEGYGLWFANPRLEDNTTLDSVHCWDTYVKTFVPDSGDAFIYTVWIHKTAPESSFSNFGLIMDGREPDFEYRDGFPSHAPGKFGPSDPIFRPGQPPLQGVQLGSDPVIEEGVVVGYRYVVTDRQDVTHTCVIRVDDPSLTRCNSDTFQVLAFEDQFLLPKAFRITDGDTTITTSLGGVLDVGDPFALAALPNGAGFLFTGWEYEAWLIFTEASGIPPLSLGRFKSPRAQDSQNPHTYTDTRYDRNFQFPGEDFLQNLSSHHPSLNSPLDIIHDPRVEKVWITIEPDDDFGFDIAPDEPNSQLIYLSAYLPKDLDTVGTAQVPLVHRDLNPNPAGLNNGNAFPTVTVQFLPPPIE